MQYTEARALLASSCLSVNHGDSFSQYTLEGLHNPLERLEFEREIQAHAKDAIAHKLAKKILESDALDLTHTAAAVHPIRETEYRTAANVVVLSRSQAEDIAETLRRAETLDHPVPAVALEAHESLQEQHSIACKRIDELTDANAELDKANEALQERIDQLVPAADDAACLLTALGSLIEDPRIFPKLAQEADEAQEEAAVARRALSEVGAITEAAAADAMGPNDLF